MSSSPRRGGQLKAPDMRVFLHGLTGTAISTLTGRPNTVIRVDETHVIVGTSNSPFGKPVPIQWIQDAADRLYREGELEISVPSVGYRSAFIGAVLAQLPGTIPTVRPRWIRLRSNSGTDADS